MGSETESSYTNLGITYGLTFGAAVASVLYALTEDATFFSFIGFGLVAGLIIGSHLESSRKAR